MKLTVLEFSERLCKLYTIQQINKLDIIKPNNVNKARLNKPSLSKFIGLSEISGNETAPNNTDHKIQIISMSIITAAEVDASLKNPPGYVDIANVIDTKNTKNKMLPYTEKCEKFPKKFSPLSCFSGFEVFGKVRNIIRYKNEKTASNMVIIKEEPKYLLI
jgi:hypothetical protein